MPSERWCSNECVMWGLTAVHWLMRMVMEGSSITVFHARVPSPIHGIECHICGACPYGKVLRDFFSSPACNSEKMAYSMCVAERD